MRRSLALMLAAALAAVVSITLLSTPSNASNPSSATISYSHPTQVFVNSHPMNGGAPAGFVQTICTTQPNACDPVTFTVDPTRDGKIDHAALLTVIFEPAAPSQMGLAQYPPGCPEDNNPTGACATYFQTSSPYTFPDPGKTTLRLKVVCQSCTNGSYKLTAKLTRDPIAAKLPPAGDTSGAFKTVQLADPAPPTNVGGLPGQLTSQFGEPGIFINKHGYGIVNTFGPTVWITKDSGKTWGKAFDIIGNDTYCQTKYAGDADAVVGSDNTFYADNLCLGTFGGVDNESFTNPTGNPGDWGAPHPAGGVSDRQWYVLDPKNPKTLYLSFHGFFAPDINIFKSTDGGKHFFCPEDGLPVNPATSTGGDCPVTATSNGTIPVNTQYLDTGLGNVTTRPLIDPANPDLIYVPYADTTAEHAASAAPTRLDSDLTRFKMAVSHDGGKHWAANTDATGQGSIIDTENSKYFPVTNTNALKGDDDSTLAHIFIGAAIDTKGGLYILFSLRLGKTTPTHLYMMSSTNHGATWSAPHQVDSNGLNSNVFPAITAGDPGHIAMTWYGTKSDDFNDTKALWSEMYADSVNALSPKPTFSQSRVSSGDSAVHAADICQAGTLCAVTNGNRNLADYQSVTTDPCGFAVMTYTDDHAPAAHTMIARQTAGISLYKSPPTGCFGAASTHPVVTPPVVHPSSTPLATTGTDSREAWLGALAIALAIAAGAFAWRQRPTR
ncbi:MAG: hypothetical protein ACJ735_09725 [Actinomycetes bacterium]